MNNLFDDAGAAELAARLSGVHRDLADRVYTTRLLGGQRDLVLHGGGNTSVKIMEKDIFGRERDVLYVKGSGRNMGSINPEDFVGLELESLRKLFSLNAVSDRDMEDQLHVNKVRPHPAVPSIETLIHAFLPYKFVDHTHADSILVLTNQPDGPELIKEVLGPGAVVLPYLRPGYPLAVGLADIYEKNPEAEAIVVLGHGIFTYGNDAETAYAKMIDYVNRAEEYLARKDLKIIDNAPGPVDEAQLARLAQVARGVCAIRSDDGPVERMHVQFRSGRDVLAASLAPEAENICSTGVLTPDHVIRTKNRWVYINELPEEDEALKSLVSEAVADYSREYDEYYRRHAGSLEVEGQKLDSLPRVFLVRGLGLVCLGWTRKEAGMAADIAEHTLTAKVKALAIGGYAPITEDHVFEMEYWGLQQSKLGVSGSLPLQGQVALVTGGGGAIGLGVADCLLKAGAAVVTTDIDLKRLEQVREILSSKYGPDRVGVISFDVTDYKAVVEAYDKISCEFGGLDIIVPNAGIAHVASIEDLEPEKLDQVLSVNLKGTFNVIKASVPVFKRQGTGGNIVIISSKNVYDPGASFGAYSASKAGAHQLGKIAALELAEYGVRVNMINPDAVFGCGDVSSKLWDLVGPDRMRSRGLDPECIQDFYCQRNLLKARVSAEHVGNAVVFFAGDQTPTTGATLPVDGGVQGAFPR